MPGLSIQDCVKPYSTKEYPLVIKADEVTYCVMQSSHQLVVLVNSVTTPDVTFVISRMNPLLWHEWKEESSNPRLLGLYRDVQRIYVRNCHPVLTSFSLEIGVREAVLSREHTTFVTE